MICAHYRDALHEMVDGTPGPIRRAELQAHLDACGDCRALLDDLVRIRSLAASLEKPVPPARVWLQIAGHLRQDGRVRELPGQSAVSVRPALVRRSHALVAIAAALVVAIGASIALLFPMLRESGDPVTAATAARGTAGNAREVDAVQEDIESEFRLAEQHYQSAITKLEDAARNDTDTIDAGTAAMIQRNLQVIDAAIAESRDAVRSDPASTPARDSLFGALRRKVALLQDTIALMNEMRKGNAAGAAQLVDRANKG